MNRSAAIALISALFAASCGGTEPPQQPPPAQQIPAPQPAPPVETPAPPPAVDSGTKSPAPAPKPPSAAAAPPARPAYTRTDLQVGTGQAAQKGKQISVHYTGWLYDPSKPDMKGQMFDSSNGREPLDFQLGAGQVIPGWDQGFDGMKIGGRRRLIIPPALAYGVDGAGGVIPPNATLLFEMELVNVR